MLKDPLFSLLSPDETLALQAVRTFHDFERGEALFRAGEPVRGIYCVERGAIKITHQTQTGDSLTLRFASAGDWVGHRSIFTSETYRGSAIANGPVRVFFVPTGLLLRFFSSNKEFAHHLIRQIARDLEATEKKMLEFQKLNVASRLISLFRSLDEKFGRDSEDGREIGLKITKVEIAELIGASPEVVIRQLTKWKKETLLSESGKKYFLTNRFLSKVIRDT